MNCNEMAFFVLGMKWVCKCYGYVIRQNVVYFYIWLFFFLVLFMKWVVLA